MNYEKACFLLELDSEEVDYSLLKRKYYLKALQYHPDKNTSSEAVEQFREIKLAYDFLCKEESKITDEEVSSTTPYESIFKYFMGSLEMDVQEEYLNVFLDKILLICEKQAIHMIQTIHEKKFKVIYKILTKYRHIFHLSDSFYEEMEKTNIYRFVQGDMKKKRLYELVKDDFDICETSNPELSDILVFRDTEWDHVIEMEVPKPPIIERPPVETIILRPGLDDLWEHNLYRYAKYNLLIPLWHHELLYEKDLNRPDVLIKIIPKTPSTIWLDDMNNIHQMQEFSIMELWGFAINEKCMHVYYGTKRFPFYPHELQWKSKQCITWHQQGISRVNEINIYDVSLKSDVFLHVHIRSCS